MSPWSAVNSMDPEQDPLDWAFISMRVPGGQLAFAHAASAVSSVASQPAATVIATDRAIANMSFFTSLPLVQRPMMPGCRRAFKP